jgi:hypothetical protein
VSGELRLPFSARVSRASDLAAISAVFERARSEEWATRLADKDVTLWSRDAEVQAKIANRLGWLDAPVHFTEQVPALEAFGEKVRDAGLTTAIVAGMGGSSLAPEVLATAFASISEWLKIRVCDSTDPEAVAQPCQDAGNRCKQVWHHNGDALVRRLCGGMDLKRAQCRRRSIRLNDRDQRPFTKH